MNEREDPPDRPKRSDLADDEPEPDWAAEIRRLRRARGDRLKRVFETFDDEEQEER
jgi:hypothetical protein